MTVYFTKNDDLILFHFNMKKLNIFNFLRIKMMKISFEIIRHHCFVLAKINLQIKIYKVKGKKEFNQMAAKAKNVELAEAYVEAFTGVFRTQSNI